MQKLLLKLLQLFWQNIGLRDEIEIGLRVSLLHSLNVNGKPVFASQLKA